jgi:uncharacterized damage-inducible protein DinB
MRNEIRLFSGSLLLGLLAVAPLAAQADAPTGYRGDLLRDVADIETKVRSLAEAIPADKLGWRPSEGVRSVSEVMMHIAGANYFFPTLFGGKVPAGVDMANLEKITDKTKLMETLQGSFEQMRTMIQNTPDDKLDDTIKMFGNDATVAGGLHAAVAHGHEHLGQLIAYARSIGVAPPWSG